MNKNDRKQLEKAIGLIEDAKEIVTTIQAEEQEKFDNLTEGLQQSENGQKFEQNASTLSEVESQLDNCIELINETAGN